ncbi:BtrH N-terminal domain-containing protein [Plebeiibacterium marinum]|uniref:BtrH N-terminal domain-containing protein n=1 Tax=Plebeiibacterium marinum TaxID=2992111 RepID=A0AAE3ME61_9BACT|nr:BtrH N-terminal domain-containing protein [Plebeiobacterium marinum]MCW3805786.1 BtrH N-terminal domain-containing protein [Plebeiobacterium marinum]
MKIEFDHQMSSHCENGVTRNLLRHEGIDISEPMVFGIGAGLFFAYLPFIKLHGAPVFSFRPMPGHIFKHATKNLGIKVKSQKFRSPAKAMAKLDENLSKGIPTGMVVGVYHLSYFPPQYRFHFNAHNIVGLGKEDNQYYISDPIMENVEMLSQEELIRVRFAKGTGSPKGKMYSVECNKSLGDLDTAIKKGIKKNVTQMLHYKGIVGVDGMMYLSKRMRKWPKKYGNKKAERFLGQIVRMQEEIGTGGAGFRFLYASFLQEAAQKLENTQLDKLSADMTQIGDLWREFAVEASRIYKKRAGNTSYNDIADRLYDLGQKEKVLFTHLGKAIK